MSLPNLTTRIFLGQEQPLTTRVLSQKLGLHQSSVSHILKGLMEEDLVAKKGKSYYLTSIGIVQRNIQEWTGKSQRCLRNHIDFLVLRCFPWLTLSYHEIGSRAGIKKSASRITNHLVQMAWLTSWRICIPPVTPTPNSKEPFIHETVKCMSI